MRQTGDKKKILTVATAFDKPWFLLSLDTMFVNNKFANFFSIEHTKITNWVTLRLLSEGHDTYNRFSKNIIL